MKKILLLFSWLVIFISLGIFSCGAREINLSDPDIARANDLLTKFDRFPSFAVPFVAKTPMVDGIVGEEEWAEASSFTGLVSFITRHVVQKPTCFFVQHDAEYVYLAFKLDRLDGSEPQVKTSGHVNKLWNKEDGVELVLSMDRDRRSIFSIYVNGASGYSDGALVDRGLDTAWNGNYLCSSRVTPQGIEGELRFTKKEFEDFMAEKNLVFDSKSWGVNPMRVDRTPTMEQAELTDMWGGAGKYSGDFLGNLLLRSDGVAVRIKKLGALENGDIGIDGEIINSTDETIPIKLDYSFYKANRDVRDAKIFLYQTWDKINRIRTTGSDFDEGEAVQLLRGEDDWLKELGQAYSVAKDGVFERELIPGSKIPFMISFDGGGGQYLFAYKITHAVSGELLWTQTVPVEVKDELIIKVTKRFLTLEGVIVTTDVSGNREVREGDKLYGTVRTQDNGEVISLWESIIANPSSPVEQFIPISGPPGKYTAEIFLKSKSGTELNSAKIDFDKPQTPFWFQNKIGYSEEVPAPCINVQAEKSSATVWGRTYTWENNNPLPKQIITQGHELLVAPLQFKLRAGGREYKWQTQRWQLVETTKRTATYAAIHKAGPYTLDLTITVDFDGLMRFKGTLVGNDTPIDNLSVVFPLRKEMVTHYHAAYFETDLATADRKFIAGAIESFKEGATPFAGLFWLGGPEGGLQWIAEWDKGWNNVDRKKVMVVQQTEEGTSLIVNMIDKRTILKEALPIDFAFNVSPVKDTSYYWPISGYVSGASNYIKVNSFDEEKCRADLMTMKNLGFTHVATGGYGWPFHADIWVRDHNRPNFKEISDLIHELGLKQAYYGCWGVEAKGEEFNDFGHDLIKIPVETAGTDTYWYNPEGPWVDFFMAGLDSSIKEFGLDGLYLDSMTTTNIVGDPRLGQTYTDENGRLHGRWPIFALREWALRLATVFHITHMTDGIVYQHGSTVPNLAIDSLADIRCGGEDAPSSDRLLESWPLDPYFARYSTHAFGIPLVTLWYNWWNRPLKENQVLSVILLNGQLKRLTGGDYIVPKRLKPDYELMSTPHVAINQLFQGFDIPKAEWWPYYGKSNWVSLEPKSVLASSYLHRGQKALVIVSNLKPQDITTTVTLDLKGAGFTPGNVKVTDAFLNTEIPLQGNKLKIDIYGERYRILLVEAR